MVQVYLIKVEAKLSGSPGEENKVILIGHNFWREVV